MQEWIARRRKSDDPEYQPKPFNAADTDSEYQRDRARVIHSAAFRRLQSKTQVLGIGESDFYRTRLTHSLEVAQISSSILRNIQDAAVDQSLHSLLPSQSIIETIGLLHDLGHPPFGHGGEIALNYKMKDDGGFEGNGQTLRIMSKLGEYSPSHGLDLTRRVMLGALKYPCLYSEVVIHKDYHVPGDCKPPKCIFDDESAVRDWIFEPFSAKDIAEFKKSEEVIKDNERKNNKPIYKSFDTSILELADDTAYGVHDLEDALALQLIDENVWNKEISPSIFSIANGSIAGEDENFYRERLFSGSGKGRKHAISKLVGYFVTSVTIKHNSSFDHPLLSFNATFPDEQMQILEILKKFVKDQVIMRPQVQALEFKGQEMILKLFDVLHTNPKRLLPKNTFETYEKASTDPAKKRVICDFISGMTDPYAIKVYQRIFSPDFGSIYDRI